MRLSLAGLLCIYAILTSAGGTVLPYQWIVKYENTSAEGYPKLSITINGRTPGPTISAYERDILIIEVTNCLGMENLAIQWQGVRQAGGAGTETIPPGRTFTFQLSLDQPGEYQYSSCSELQKEAGMCGWIHVLPRTGGQGVPFKEGADVSGKLPLQVKGCGLMEGSKSP